MQDLTLILRDESAPAATQLTRVPGNAPPPTGASATTQQRLDRVLADVNTFRVQQEVLDDITLVAVAVKNAD